MSIDATVQGANANSYATVAEGDTYASERIPAPAAWNAALTASKEAALKMACRRLQQERWQGMPVLPFTQALSWPRYGVLDINGYAITVYTSIPDFVKRAQFELAFALLTDDIVSNTGLEPFDSVQAGPVNVQPTKGYRAYALPESCRREIAHVLIGGGTGIALVRG